MSTALDQPEPFAVRAKPNGGCVVLEVKGELDLCNAPLLAAEPATQNGAARDLVIDLSEVTFIDSTGIHTLVRACEENGTRVVCPPGNVRRVFDIVSFGKVAPLHERLEDALAD